MEPEQTGNAIRAFMSPTCPFCAAAKLRVKDGFCENCLQQLPDELMAAMRDETKFLDNFHPAMAFLNT